MEEGGVRTGIALGAFVAKNAAFGVESGRYEIREMDFGELAGRVALSTKIERHPTHTTLQTPQNRTQSTLEEHLLT